MISEALKKTREKYQVQLDELLARKEAEVNAKVAEYRAELLSAEDADVEALKSVIAGLDELIKKEESLESVEVEKEEVVEEKPIAVEEIAVYEQVAEETKDDVVEEEPIVEEQEVVEEAVEEPIEEVAEEQVEEVVEEPIVEAKVEEKKPKFSFFAKRAKAEEVKQEVKQEVKVEVKEEPKVEPKKTIARPGLVEILNPKRK